MATERTKHKSAIFEKSEGSIIFQKLHRVLIKDEYHGCKAVDFYLDFALDRGNKMLYIEGIMVNRMRHTKSHRNNRRSHHAITPAGLSVCAKCGSMKLPHYICENCGTYNNREVIDVLAKLTKKEKKQKEKELAAQEEAQAGEKPMDAAALSKK